MPGVTSIDSFHLTFPIGSLIGAGAADAAIAAVHDSDVIVQTISKMRMAKLNS